MCRRLRLALVGGAGIHNHPQPETHDEHHRRTAGVFKLDASPYELTVLDDGPVQPESLADVPPHCLAVTLDRDGNECVEYRDSKGVVYHVDGRMTYHDASRVKVVRPIGYIEINL